MQKIQAHENIYTFTKYANYLSLGFVQFVNTYLENFLLSPLSIQPLPLHYSTATGVWHYSLAYVHEYSFSFVFCSAFYILMISMNTGPFKI